uniref:PAP-associated domain-containing protein n=1 Tax=Panagrolaimus sp. JU765 TaxID=591449 RepID=A0AC34R9D5_9BILA
LFQREFEKLLKQEAVKVLMGTIKDNPHFSKGKFVIVGSTINGTAATKSDLDLHFCMNVPNDRMPSLKQLCEHLKRQRCVTSVYPIFLTTVPIVQVVLNPPYDLLRIEISIDSCHAVHTTHLVRHYMKMDYRARYLAFLVKEWAVNQNIRTPSNGTMSGISLVIMVIHFLQCCCNPPILPNLQFTRQDLFSNNIPTERLVEIEDASSLFPCQMPSNDATLGELFIAFFEYYSNFGFDQNGISLEHGGIISRDELSVETDRRGMYVDEPFAHFNTLRSLVDYDLVLQSIKDAFHLLNGHKLNEAAPDFKILMHQKNSL